jgi:DNA replication protein DnaC
MDSVAKIIEMMPVKKGIITRREYEWLKSFESLEPHELEKIKEFEASLEVSESKKQVKKEPIVITKGLVPDKKTIWKGFLQAFLVSQGKEFSKTPDTLANLEPVLKYFAKDDTFFDCKNLVRTFNGKELENSFEKGLLIIGDYGNGKTTIMQCFEVLFKKNFEIAMTENWDTIRYWQSLRFKSSKSHDVVTEFETISNPEAKDNFYKKYNSFRYYFDDVKKEKTASNYGKTEIIREIIEKRYDKKAKTYITCNYREGYSGNLQDALVEFGDRYGGHIYDRLFEMFNIIEFKGKSFRK